MFDKIQSTYFKRVTTGVLALFMTASSGFSYAVPVYAEEVTTAAAKRKKEEEFSSTESSTLQLNENSTKEEVKNNQDTGNDDVKVTTNGSSEDQPEVTYEKPDTKEPGRKLSSEEAQKDLKKIIENKKYSYEVILQRIFEIDDFSFYSSMTSDDIKFLMSGKTEEKYEILEILKLKSVNYYDYNSLSPKKFYLSLFSYFKLIDQCDEELSKDVKKQIQDQVLKDINQFYIKEESQYYENINDFYVNDMQDFENVSKEDGAKYVDAISTYIYTKSDERDKNVIRKALDLEEVDEETDEKELEDWATNNKDGSFTIKDHLDSLKGTEESYNQGGDYGYSTNNYFYVTIHDKGGNDTNATINITGRSSKYGNKDKELYQHMLKNQTTWDCSMTINGANNHNLSLTHNTVTTKQDKFKGTDGQYAWFVMNFKISYTRHSYYYNKGCSYDKNDADIRFNTKNYTLDNTGDDGNSIERGYTSYDKPVTANIQINTGHTGTRTFNHYRYRGGRVTINYTRETHTIRYDANGGYGAPGNQTKTMGVDLWLSSTTPSRSQYVFKGWNTQANGSGTSYSPGQQFYPDADTTLYAQWEEDTSYQYLDVNGVLDGNQANNTDGMGKFDVYINGQLVSDPSGSIDFYDKYKVGSKYEIKNIRPNSGISYDHASPGLSGTITGYTSINLYFNTGYTLSIDPNGGTYKGSSGVTTVNHLSPGATITVDSPTRPGYKFGGYEKSNESYQSYASNTGWTTSHGENVGTYSRSYDGSITYNEAPDGGYYRTNHVWRGIDSATDNYNCISFPTYTAQAGHTYKISGEVWISERPSGGSFALNFYHGDSSNDWKHCMWGISEGWTGKWVKFSIERTFDTTTNDARFEIWTSNLKGLTGNISFWLQGLKITDETTGNDVSMTKIAMGDSDIKLTARWIPLHSTLSYDAQGGSLGSVKSTDNPNNYKIVDNGAYFIQSGLNTSRYLHQRTNGQLNLDNATDVLTWNGYSSDSKQTLWTFERYKNTPYYYIINNFNGKAMNLSGDGPDDLSGKPIELWEQYDANNEDNFDFLWYFKDTGDGYVNIYNKMTNKALDITNGEDADGVVLQQYAPNGTASQKFKLVNYSQVYFPTREKYANNNIYINSATPVKKGCKFLGWNTKEDGSGKTYQPGNLYDVNQDGGNVTLYAQWEKEKYTATVKLNGGSYNGSTKDFTISKYPGEEISIGAPTRSKHNFAGYKLTMDNNDGNVPTSVTQSASGFKGIMQMGNFTLNAQWTPWKHTVTYNANAGNDASVKGIPASQSKTANVDIKLSSSVPTRNGYTFLGWNTQANGNGTAYAAGATYTHDQDGGTVTLYAQWTPWKHVLHYNKNVPTSSTSQTVSNMPVDQTKTFGQLMTISNLVPTRKGYTFAGWYTQSNGTGTKYDPGSNYAADQNGGTVNLYAKWTPWTYNIKYDQNVKSTSSSKTVTDMPNAQTKTQEIDVTLSSMTPKRNGYIFAGWSTSANGSVEYKPGSRFTKDLDSNGASITLYAVWTPWKHTIHYNSNIPTNAPTGTTTVSNMPGDQTKTFDEKLMISSNKPTRKGYNFAGWSTSANGNVVYQPGAEYKNDQNGGTVTLYAKWTAWKHTVTYDKNVPANSKKTDVKNMPGNQTKIYDQNLTLQSNVPTRIGYTFVKWTTNKDGTGTAYQPGSQYSYNRDSDGGTVTLYAVWTPWKYTVRYDKNVPANSSSQTVSNMPADQTKTEEVALTLSSNKPSRNGYIFNGWQTQINGKAVDYQPGATLSYDPDVKGSVITLKAKWTAWKHTIHYDKNVPASSSSQTVANMPEDDTKTFDITKTISSTKPSRNGYIFNGWNTQKDGKGTAYASGAAYKHDQNGGTVTLYAQWTPWKHTVTYDKNVDPSSSSQTVTNMPGNQTKTFDEKLMISSTKPSRNGYIFNGWNTQKDGKGTAYASGAEYKHDQNGNTVTLYAQWTAWKHTVHYNANGGDQNSVPTDQTKTFDQAMILSDKKPTRHGYNFVRWNTKADGTGTSYEVKGNYNHDQNGGTVTLYAIWTPWVHTVHYDANGGDQNSVPNDQKKTYGQSMNVATKVPTRNEYKFLGWTTGKDGSGTFYNPGDAYYHDQNGQTVTLYAKWIQLYTVKYDGNQPAIKGVTVTGSVANQTQGQDESVNLRTNNFKNDSGVYKDWSVGKDAYKYGKLDGKIREFIHPEGFKTNHSTMQNEYTGYEGQIKLIHS
ncbi:InlB B-repeat-containing protein [Anaerostipes hadrus]|uniref:InlB B-repeat-containing protein n=1 Tax=Anaerostipes hadrus TaxID=649756 RepID=UPI0032C10C52